MISHADPGAVRNCIRFAWCASAAATLVGILALFGWLFDIEFLKGALAGYAAMKPLTALCFISAGVSLGGCIARPGTGDPRRKLRLAARALGVIVITVSLTTLVERIFQLDAGLDELLFRDTLTTTWLLHPGRMAPATALALLSLGIALLSIDARSRRATLLSQGAATLGALIGLLAIIGYLYDVGSLYHLFAYSSMAPHTSALFLVLGLGILFARPERGALATVTSDYAGGSMARRILPVAIVVPTVAGGLWLVGERAGLYDNAFGTALFATSNILVFGTVAWLSARSLNRAGAKARRALKDLRDANERLSASEERFRLFMRHLPAVAFLKDAQGRYVWGNAAWRRRFPDEWGSLWGKTDADLWPPDTAAVFAASDERVLTGGEPIQLIESSTIDSEVRHWIVSKFPITGPEGDVLIGGVSFDTTESKRLESQLHQAQKLEAIGLLAGGVAHDFNNLLTVMLGYTDLARNASRDDKSRLDSLDEIRNAGERAAVLTAQLLAFGRKQVIQPRALRINAVLVGMQRMLRRVVRENVALNFSLDNQTGVVRSDPNQIQQVVINLVINAQDAMPEGGSVTVETANVEFDDSYSLSHREVQPGPFVMLAVSDTGMGMDPATQSHIFEPFFTTKRLGKGTGLGLATVYGIVKQNGGHIWVYSEVGKGTSFKIYLPRVEAPELSTDPEAAVLGSMSAPSAGRFILVVEDEEPVRLLIVNICSQAGYEVLAARDGGEALALSDSHPGMIHLLITDVVMPRMSGRDLADEMVQRRPDTKVLYCSGYAENAIVHHGVLDTGVAFLQKPFTATTLLQRVRELLS
jgi:signal transduction histidine kinase/CheY-like chemotaxis protein